MEDGKLKIEVGRWSAASPMSSLSPSPKPPYHSKSGLIGIASQCSLQWAFLVPIRIQTCDLYTAFLVPFRHGEGVARASFVISNPKSRLLIASKLDLYKAVRSRRSNIYIHIYLLTWSGKVSSCLLQLPAFNLVTWLNFLLLAVLHRKTHNSLYFSNTTSSWC